MIGIGPKYLFSAIKEEEYDDYRRRAQERERRVNRVFIEGIMGNTLFKAKDSSPWQAVGEGRVFLDPRARVSRDEENEYTFAGLPPAS